VEKITGRSNPICTHIRKLGKSKSYRDEHSLFLCDGVKLLDEALDSGASIDTVLVSNMTEKNLPRYRKLPPDISVYSVHEELLDSLSPLNNSQGVLFTCRMKSEETIDFSSGTHLLLDDIQDPGNVGTIIRCAYAFGIDSVSLTEGSADIYNPKTLRATMGAVFKQPVIRLDRAQIFNLKGFGARIIGTTNDSDSHDISFAELNNAIIVLGNVGHGISDDLKALCDQMIKIPLKSGCESINVAVAASILMWEASKTCQH